MENTIRPGIPSLSIARTTIVSATQTAGLMSASGSAQASSAHNAQPANAHTAAYSPSIGGAQGTGDGIRVSAAPAQQYQPATTQINPGHTVVVTAPHSQQTRHSGQPQFSQVQSQQQQQQPQQAVPSPTTQAHGEQYCYEWVTDSSGVRILVRTRLEQHARDAKLGQQQAKRAPPQPQYCQVNAQPASRSYQQHVQQGSPQHQYQRAAQRLPLQQQYQQVSAQPLPGAAQPQYQQYTAQPTPVAATHLPPRSPHIVYQQQPASKPAYRTEFRCSPTSGQVWQVRVPDTVSTQTLQPATPVAKFKYEWRIHPHTGVS